MVLVGVEVEVPDRAGGHLLIISMLPGWRGRQPGAAAFPGEQPVLWLPQMTPG